MRMTPLLLQEPPPAAAAHAYQTHWALAPLVAVVIAHIAPAATSTTAHSMHHMDTTPAADELFETGPQQGTLRTMDNHQTTCCNSKPNHTHTTCIHADGGVDRPLRSPSAGEATPCHDLHTTMSQTVSQGHTLAAHQARQCLHWRLADTLCCGL